jgi:hypothetical protein
MPSTATASRDVVMIDPVAAVTEAATIGEAAAKFADIRQTPCAIASSSCGHYLRDASSSLTCWESSRRRA